MTGCIRNPTGAVSPNSATDARPAGPDDVSADDTPRERRDRQHAAWLHSASAGGPEAAADFERFFDATLGPARAVARRMLGGDDAEDLLADAYFEAWRKRADFDPDRGSPLTWLLSIVHSRALDRLRQRRSEQRVRAPELMGDASGEPDTAPGPLDLLWQRQSEQRLAVAVATLPATERWLLGLAYWREMSHSAIVTCTGLPLGTVKSHLRRAQARLRQALGDDAFGPPNRNPRPDHDHDPAP